MRIAVEMATSERSASRRRGFASSQAPRKAQPRKKRSTPSAVSWIVTSAQRRLTTHSYARRNRCTRTSVTKSAQSRVPSPASIATVEKTGKPTVRQVYALAAALCERMGEEFPESRGDASELIERLRIENGHPAPRLEDSS